MKKTIFIIGSTGFLGRNITENLISNKYTVVLLVRDLKSAQKVFVEDEYTTLIEGELNDFELIQSTFIKLKVDLVIHLASNLIPISGFNEFNNELNTIVIPTFKILEFLCLKKIKIIYISSGGTIYGKQSKILKENVELNPINYYGYSKLMIENYIKYLYRTKELQYLILRPSNVYGKYQKIESKQGFIAVVLGKFLNNKNIEIWGDGNVIRDYLDVSDLSYAIKKLLDNDICNETFNIGSGEGKNLNEIVKLFEKKLNKKCEIVYKDKRFIDTDKVILNIQKIQNTIYFIPKKIECGINDLIKNIGDKNDVE